MALYDKRLYDEYKTYIDGLHGDVEGKRQVRRVFANSNSTWGKKPLPCNYLPFLGSIELRNSCVAAGNILYSILSKIIKQYRDNASYRKLFSFDKRIEELILMPNTCCEELPFMRVDFIYSEEKDSMIFCEFNTDACGGMVEQMSAIRAVRECTPFQRFAEGHQVITDEVLPYQGWVDAYAAMYEKDKTSGLASDGSKRPRLAIVVCFDNPNPDISMFKDFMPYFNKAGFDVSIFDVRELGFDGEVLHGNKALYGQGDTDIDCVWKFCVTVDLIQHWLEVQPFIEAMRSNRILIAGAFSTQLAHDKQIMAIMRHPITQKFLTREEGRFIEEHIPYTVLLENIIKQDNLPTDYAPTIADIKEAPEKWILKPADWYASIDVVAGRSCTQPEWSEIIDSCVKETMNNAATGKHWLLQRFYPPGKAPAIPLHGKESDYTAPLQYYGNMFGIFMHSGKYGGVFLRQGPRDVIGDSTGGINGAVIWVN